MPAGKGRMVEKTEGRPLDFMSAIKNGIVVVKTAFLCLTHAQIIAMAGVNGDPKYKSYRNWYRLKKKNLLKFYRRLPVWIYAKERRSRRT